VAAPRHFHCRKDIPAIHVLERRDASLQRVSIDWTTTALVELPKPAVDGVHRALLARVRGLHELDALATRKWELPVDEAGGDGVVHGPFRGCADRVADGVVTVDAVHRLTMRRVQALRCIFC